MFSRFNPHSYRCDGILPGFPSDTENPHAIVTFRSPEVTVTIFRSLKVTIQGTQLARILDVGGLLEFDPVPNRSKKPPNPMPLSRRVRNYTRSRPSVRRSRNRRLLRSGRCLCGFRPFFANLTIGRLEGSGFQTDER